MENRPLNTPGFTDRMTRGELIAAAIYLPIHVVGIPFGISWLAEALPWLYTLSNTQLNVICYGLGLAFVLIGLRGWLRRSFDAALDAKGSFLLGIVGGYAVNIALSFVISALILLLGIGLGSSPNNEAVMAESATQMGRIAVVTVVMAPMVEEPLFRGLLFGCIRPRSRVLAYAVSALAFALYHVWQYIYVSGDFSLLVYCLSYLPASFALAWAYERGGGIWSSIALHAVMNALSVYVLSGAGY